jgi:hypothetical protein
VNALDRHDVALPLEAVECLAEIATGTGFSQKHEDLGEILERVCLKDQGVRAFQELDCLARELLRVAVEAPPGERLRADRAPQGLGRDIVVRR